MKKPLEILNRKTVWEGNFIRALLLEYKNSRGDIRGWEAVERVNCSGIVVIIPVTRQGDLLLIRQFRPVLNNYVLEFPAGLNDRGETLVDAARRELIEETGYTSEGLEFMAEGPVSSGLSTEVLTVFLARDAFPAPPDLIKKYPVDETEEIEVVKTPLASAYDTIEKFRKKGDIADLKIYGFIELARQRIGI
ncbi:MAG TPA: NUDIX hydrolase [Dissulfurispiraceae bacterium]|nr:NUDIX hydrolase [Dissulfurispiraceae bacterium]